MPQPPAPSVENGVVRVKIGSPAYVVDGLKVIIVCNVNGGSPVRISWLHNDQPSPTRVNMTTATVNDASHGDVFTCIAENEMGIDKQSTRIVFIQKHSDFCIAKHT